MKFLAPQGHSQVSIGGQAFAVVEVKGVRYVEADKEYAAILIGAGYPIYDEPVVEEAIKQVTEPVAPVPEPVMPVPEPVVEPVAPVVVEKTAKEKAAAGELFS